MKTASILGVHFHAVTMEQAVSFAMSRLRARQKGYVVTPNPEIVDLCRRDSVYMGIVNHAALVLTDGVGIIYAAKILGEELYGKVAGVEFAEHLVAAMAKEQMRLYLLGAKPGVAEQAGKNLCEKYQLEKEGAERQIAELEKQLSETDCIDAEVEEYIARLKRYAKCEELTREMCLQLIEFITIGERPADDKPREIHIYYKLISGQTLADYREQITK